ncbi:hypothetical protein Cni_G06910 [Canna indica]|uniref:Uncharacterized protein n=1 Tax=Canna indica TaxID=4628 RepID=A0AAQ3Q6G8_9LILI|nr:hypothetical protein Cni_G06910 [Canna indica]
MASGIQRSARGRRRLRAQFGCTRPIPMEGIKRCARARWWMGWSSIGRARTSTSAAEGGYEAGAVRLRRAEWRTHSPCEQHYVDGMFPSLRMSAPFASTALKKQPISSSSARLPNKFSKPRMIVMGDLLDNETRLFFGGENQEDPLLLKRDHILSFGKDLRLLLDYRRVELILSYLCHGTSVFMVEFCCCS